MYVMCDIVHEQLLAWCIPAWYIVIVYIIVIIVFKKLPLFFNSLNFENMSYALF